MGLPVSVPAAILLLLAPDCQDSQYRGYDIKNCTWTWGYVPEGEIAYALKTSDLTYYLQTPAQFDASMPSPTSTMTTMTSTEAPLPTETPLMWLQGMMDYEWEDLVENDGWDREVMERARKRIRLMKFQEQ